MTIEDEIKAIVEPYVESEGAAAGEWIYHIEGKDALSQDLAAYVRSKLVALGEDLKDEWAWFGTARGEAKAVPLDKIDTAVARFVGEGE